MDVASSPPSSPQAGRSDDLSSLEASPERTRTGYDAHVAETEALRQRFCAAAAETQRLAREAATRYGCSGSDVHGMGGVNDRIAKGTSSRATNARAPGARPEPLPAPAPTAPNLQLQYMASQQQDTRQDNAQLKAQLRALRTARNGAEALNAELWRKYNAVQAQLAAAEAARVNAEARAARITRSSKRLRVSHATDQDVHEELRRRLGDSESECTALETQLAACRADTGELQAERDQLRHELATVSGTATQLRRLHQEQCVRSADLEDELVTTRSRVTALSSQLAAAEQTLAAEREIATSAREALRQMHRDWAAAPERHLPPASSPPDRQLSDSDNDGDDHRPGNAGAQSAAQPQTPVPAQVGVGEAGKRKVAKPPPHRSESASRTNASQLAACRAELASLHAELAASKRQTAAFHRRADALQKENGDLINEKENLLGEVNETVEALEKAQQAADARVLEVEAMAAESVSRLEADMQQARETLAACEVRAKTVATSQATLERQLKEERQAHAACRERLSAAEAEVQRASTTAPAATVAAQREAAELRRQVQTLQREMQSLRHAATTAHATAETEAARAEAASGDASQARDALATAESRAAAAVAAQQASEARAASAEDRCGKAERAAAETQRLLTARSTAATTSANDEALHAAVELATAELLREHASQEEEWRTKERQWEQREREWERRDHEWQRRDEEWQELQAEWEQRASTQADVAGEAASAAGSHEGSPGQSPASGAFRLADVMRLAKAVRTEEGHGSQSGHSGSQDSLTGAGAQVHHAHLSPIWPADGSLFETKLAQMLSLDLKEPFKGGYAVKDLLSGQSSVLQDTEAALKRGAPPPYAEAAIVHDRVALSQASVSVQTQVCGLSLEAERAQHRAATAALHGQLARAQAEVRVLQARQVVPRRAATTVGGEDRDEAQLRAALSALAGMLLSCDGVVRLTTGQRQQVTRLLQLTRK